MIVEVINTGSELLLGHTLNTHLGYLSSRLLPLGLQIQRQQTVPDGPEIEHALREALSRSEIIIVTGGLGPTSDDLTRDIAARLFQAPLEFHPEILEIILGRFARRKICPPDMVRVQAFVPKGAAVLPNEHGTAPGLYFERDGKHIFFLPGPPNELHPMFEDSVLPRLRGLSAGRAAILSKTLRVYGQGESFVQEAVEKPVKKLGAIEVGYCARAGEVDLRLMAQDPDLLARAADLARHLLGHSVYAEDEAGMEETVVHLATQKNCTLATAESCTGGLVAHRLTNVPGASAVFLRGWVTYSNLSKIEELGVREETLRAHGAVSAETASEMARGALQKSKAALAVAVTGIAGPGGGTAEKPVGTTFFALAQLNFNTNDIKVATYAKHLVPQREVFKTMASQFALDLLRRALLALN
ncbi:MAG: competence/damage-inducible protein A [Methylacidiphilales bacterium]|nr:competence/damage-inducible protein A [Candidatus Methylacidiphilales bacterium]